jgi:hypothetical protein
MPEPTEEEYGFNCDEDGVWRHGGFDTREEALAEATDYYDFDDNIRHVFTGRYVPVTLPATGYADAVIDRLIDWAYDHFGELAEDWPEATPEMRAELDAEFAAVLKGWLDRHGLTPNWKAIVEVREHELPARGNGEK